MTTGTLVNKQHPASPGGDLLQPRKSNLLTMSIPVSAFTLAGFRSWVKSEEFPDKLRAAYIEQRIHFDMSKEELETHNKVKMEIARGLLNLNRTLQLGTLYGDGALVTNESAGVSNNPDGTFVTWDSLEGNQVRLVPREGDLGQYLEIEGTPDWVMEVVSDSSEHKDCVLLRAAYHRAGIPEYWLIDARGPESSFQILHRQKKGYVAASIRKGWQTSRTFSRSFRLTRVRGRLDMWEYTLQVKTA